MCAGSLDLVVLTYHEAAKKGFYVRFYGLGGWGKSSKSGQKSYTQQKKPFHMNHAASGW